MKHPVLFASAFTLLAATTAAAQERGVSRRMFTFLDTDVTVEVVATAPGTLQIVRGEPGVIEAAGRVPGGLSTFALGGRDGDKLRITAVGGERAEFIVVVPEDAYVRVQLPNHRSGDVASSRSGGTFNWGDAPTGSAPAPATFNTRPTGPTMAYANHDAPHQLSVPVLNAVRTVSVRFGASAFQVGGDHYMTVVNGNTQNIEVRTGTEAENLIVTVPADTREFTLKLGGRTALVVRGIEVTAYCEPMTEQVIGAYQHWFTFAPEMGRLSCR